MANDFDLDEEEAAKKIFGEHKIDHVKTNKEICG